MNQPETFTSDQQKALEQFVSAVQSAQGKITAPEADYINALVSASFTVGPSGANMQGWITYTESGAKVHFQLDGSPSSYWGLFAGGGALPLIGALRPETIGGKVGEFEAHGVAGGGALSMKVDGKPVLTTVLPLAGAGPPFFGWGAKGKVRFGHPIS